jgi:hypothetical protein
MGISEIDLLSVVKRYRSIVDNCDDSRIVVLKDKSASEKQARHASCYIHFSYFGFPKNMRALH